MKYNTTCLNELSRQLKIYVADCESRKKIFLTNIVYFEAKDVCRLRFADARRKEKAKALMLAIYCNLIPLCYKFLWLSGNLLTVKIVASCCENNLLACFVFF